MQDKLSSGRAGTAEAISVLRELFPSDLYDSLFLVGGAVRDHLQGKQFQDIDMVTKLPSRWFLERGFHCVKGKSTDPIFFTTHPLFGKIEVCVLSQEVSLEDDLLRRDFKCNAVLMSLNGTIYDPLEGVEDIRTRVLRPCTAGIFVADPIRFFRALRFVSHGWRLSTDLKHILGQSNLEEELSGIPVERFTREMCTAMLGEDPCSFFFHMIEFNVGMAILPELFLMKGIPAGPSTYHGNEDLLDHSLASLRRMSTATWNLSARFAALFHDLGKIATPIEQLPRHIGHDRAGVYLTSQMATRIRLPDRIRRAIAASCKLHLTGGRWGELRDSSKIKLAENTVKSGIVEFFPELIAADRNTVNPMPGWHRFVALVKMSATDIGMKTDSLAQMGARDRKSLIMRYRLRMLNQLKSGEAIES